MEKNVNDILDENIKMFCQLISSKYHIKFLTIYLYYKLGGFIENFTEDQSYIYVRDNNNEIFAKICKKQFVVTCCDDSVAIGKIV